MCAVAAGTASGSARVAADSISRWRALGLVSRRLVFDGRKRVGFLRSSVDRFVKNNAERVERGSRFSQLTDEQRDEFIDRAHQMADSGMGQAEIARQLAARSTADLPVLIHIRIESFT